MFEKLQNTSDKEGFSSYSPLLGLWPSLLAPHPNQFKPPDAKRAFTQAIPLGKKSLLFFHDPVKLLALLWIFL